jgi:predicted nucleic acid-binding protein
MIILDTTVVSEALKVGRHQSVMNWLDSQSADTVYLSAISLAELLLGVAIMPSGKRKLDIETGLTTLLATLFKDRILSFDGDAAVIYANLVAAARKTGRVVSLADGQIGAIAAVNDFSVATRDTEPFEAMGVAVINPWAL